MSNSDLQDVTGAADAAAKPPLTLDVKVESPQACIRHVIVTVSKADVQRYLKEAYDELVPEAQVPGFRAGRAPRKLVEKQFRERVLDQVKGSLLMDSLSQVTEEAEFSAISEPDFDYESIELPEDGNFRYEFDVEVRPEFETPDWKGLELKRPVEEISEADVDEALDGLLGRYSYSEATDEPAEMGDSLVVTAVFKKDGKVLSEMDEERVTLKPVVSFYDARCENFGELLEGVVEGQSRSGKVKLSDGIDDESLRGEEVDATFEVIEVMRHVKPELTPAFLSELGDFESVDELRGFIRESLERQAAYREEQEIRKQVTEKLTAEANFELPPELVKKQTSRELDRKILELRRSGFDDDAIRRFVNAIKQNAQSSTKQALREHFILEQIAEEEKVEAEPQDYDSEIELIAEQSDQSPRRVRARLEKAGQMDAIRNQIIERKVIEQVVDKANVTEEKVEKDAKESGNDEFAIGVSVLPTKDDSAIPQAKYDESPDEGENQMSNP